MNKSDTKMAKELTNAVEEEVTERLAAIDIKQVSERINSKIICKETPDFFSFRGFVPIVKFWRHS